MTFNKERQNTRSSCCWDVIDANLECEACWRYADSDVFY